MDMDEHTAEMAKAQKIVYAGTMAEYISGFFAPGKGPRLESEPALLGFFDVLTSVRLTEPEVREALVAFAMTHEAWSAAAFVKMITEREAGDAGDAFARAQEWCQRANALPLVVDGVLQCAEGLDDLLAHPTTKPLGEAIRAMGGAKAWRNANVDDSSFRAQFRRAYDAALSRQVADAIHVPDARRAIGPGAQVLQLPPQNR